MYICRGTVDSEAAFDELNPNLIIIIKKHFVDHLLSKEHIKRLSE